MSEEIFNLIPNLRVVDYPSEKVVTYDDVISKDTEHLRLESIYPFFYLRMYADLRAAFGPDGFGKAYNHWFEHGLREGRVASPFFDAQFYLNKYSDLRRAFGKKNWVAATEHWLQHGISEGRQGSGLFDIGYYFKNNPDIHKQYNTPKLAFNHWKRHGRLEGRATNSIGTKVRVSNNTMSFGPVEQQYLRGDRAEKGFLCIIGATMLILSSMSRPDDERTARILEACGDVRPRGGEDRDREIFNEMDRNQYETDQTIRRMNTA